MKSRKDGIKNALFVSKCITYEVIMVESDNGLVKVKANSDGILVDGKHLSWESIEELKKSI